MSPKKVLFGLLAIAVVLGGITAAVMVNATSYMNRAADYARAHTGELNIPTPLPGSEAYNEAPAKVEAVARYGDTVEVQVTRRYRTAHSAEALFTVTYFYAPAGDAWHVVPPPATFWGDIKTTAGTRNTIVHTQRDQKLIDNLSIAVDAALDSACQQWQCPADTTPVQITFVTDPAAVGPLTYLVPRLTGVPMSREANTDYLSRIAADAVASLAGQLNLGAAEAQTEILRQQLYLAP